MTVVVLAPHQDDEILGACLYMEKLIKDGAALSIVFTTNGDYHGRITAKQRSMESIKAVKHLGIEPDSVYFMGYGDTGMQPSKSFLLKLFKDRTEQIAFTPNGGETYNPIGGHTVHSLLRGVQAPYTRYNFKNDLSDILSYLQPQIIVAPSQYDYHGDHRALALFLSELSMEGVLTVPIYSYLIHAGNDLQWPNRNEIKFQWPCCIPEELWRTRIICKTSQSAMKRKLKLIQCFNTQQPLALNAFLCSFAKTEEFFLLDDISLQSKFYQP